MEKIVVTRHPALVKLLAERGIVPKDVKVFDHVIEDDVRGKHVYGVLPLNLAALCVMVTEIPLTMELKDRGQELSLERLKEIAGKEVTYKVEIVK